MLMILVLYRRGGGACRPKMHYFDKTLFDAFSKLGKAKLLFRDRSQQVYSSPQGLDKFYKLKIRGGRFGDQETGLNNSTSLVNREMKIC